MKKIFIVIIISLMALSLKAQTATDSIALAEANWDTKTLHPDVVCRQAFFRSLFHSTQYISYLEITPSFESHAFHLAVNPQERKTSETASSLQARAAVNGSYYNMRTGKSICYLKEGKVVTDTTTASEFALRVTGAVRIFKGKLSLLPWNKSIEKKYKSKKDTVLSSGPLLRYEGRDCDYSMCDSSFIYTRHPRTILGLRADGTVLFITVDGRSRGNAAGMSVPELVFLCRQLGCYEAINLDGGGSTTLWASNAEGTGVLNHPSDNKRFDRDGERSVANVLYYK